MKIYSWNVNGIRAAAKNGFLEWFKSEDADIVCLQELKASEEQFPVELRNTGYFLYVNKASKPGYAGVAVFCKNKPDLVEAKLGGKRFDSEGRVLILHFKDLVIFNLYMPHGGRQKENLEYKLRAYEMLFKKLSLLKGKLLLVGDFNIAHDERDLARPKENINNIMFTKEERSQLDKLESLGYVDTLRIFEKENGHYTWWPYAFNARKRNLGWRIDYAFVSKPLEAKVKSSITCPEVLGSDHGPIRLELN